MVDRLFCFFFFSSRRRHTRLQGDWSSDVCSSDLHFKSQFLRHSAYSVPPVFRVRAEGLAFHECDLAMTQSEQMIEGHPRTPFLVQDRKSTRLNSSHLVISYAVFCLKKKTKAHHNC